MTQNQMEVARALYKPSPLVFDLTLGIVDLMQRNQVTAITFVGNSFTIGRDKVVVRRIEVENSHSALLVYFEPNPNISTQKEPFCSAFILKYNTLRKIYKRIYAKLKTIHRGVLI